MSKNNTPKTETLYLAFNWDWEDNCFEDDSDGVTLEETLRAAQKYDFFIELTVPKLGDNYRQGKCLGKLNLTR